MLTAIVHTVYGHLRRLAPNDTDRRSGAVSLEQVLWFVAAGVAVAVIAGILWGKIKTEAEHVDPGTDCALNRVVTDDADDRDRGAASLTIVLLAPLLLILMFAGFQAAMWNHTRTEARVIARETAVLVARDHVPTPQAPAAALAVAGHTTACCGTRRCRSADRPPPWLSRSSATLPVCCAVPLHRSASASPCPVEGWVSL